MNKPNRSKQGYKPPSAYVAEEAARANIERKVSLLEQLVALCAEDETAKSKFEAADRAGLLRTVPGTLRRLHFWDDAHELCSLLQLTQTPIRRIGNGTLNRHQDLRMRAERALESVNELRNASSGESKLTSEARTHRKLRRALRQVDALEKELIVMRRDIAHLTRERDTKGRQLDLLREHFDRELSMAIEAGSVKHENNVCNLKLGSAGN